MRAAGAGSSSAAVGRSVDFDLHGLAGVRLVDASPGDVAAIRRQLGPIEAPLARGPDVVIRFVDRLESRGTLRYLGVDDAGFTDDGFLVLRGRHKTRARVEIPLDRIGEVPEITCERGLAAVPLLIPILNLTVLGRGALPLHASAFTVDGVGVVCTGWSKGGKTEALLGFMEAGAGYVGDEWVYVSPDGGRVYGIPEPIRVWAWYLDQLPRVRAGVGRGDRLRLGAIELFRSLEPVVAPSRSRWAGARAYRRLEPVLRRQLHVDLDPVPLFGQAASPGAGGFDRLFFVVSHESEAVTVEPADPAEVAARMAFSLRHERLDFMAFYLKLRFAFPERRSELVERAESLEETRLREALADKETYEVRHPYPVSIAALHEALAPYCR